MKALRGPLSRQIIIAFASISMLAVMVLVYTSVAARQNEALVKEVSNRSEMALLSARIRSESMLLTDMVEAYIYHPSGKNTSREEINSQTQKLDQLIQQAIVSINPNDVDESLSLGNIRQGLIAFSTQAERVLDNFDAQQTPIDDSRLEIEILISNYQTPLVKSLEQFEQFETQRADELLLQANNTTRKIASLLMITAILTGLTASLLIYQVIVRYAMPLVRLREGVEQISAGNLTWQIDINSQDELGELAQSMNQMVTEIKLSREKMETYASTLEEQVRLRTADLRKLTMAVEQSPSAVLITDTNGSIEYANPRFTELTGYTVEEVLGKNPNILKSNLTPPETYENLWQTLIAGQSWKGEFINKKKNGDLYWEEAVISPIFSADDNKITHYVTIKEDITHRKKAEEELRRLAQLDPLTGLFNRRQLFIRGEQAIREIRDENAIGVMMLDVDHFKIINDTYGHAVGDEVLRGVAEQIHSHVRPDDIASRYGGEEFCLILPHIQQDKAFAISERIRKSIEESEFKTSSGTIRVTISIGLFMLTASENKSVSESIEKADMALYHAKQTGRNKVVIYSNEMTTPSQQQNTKKGLDNA